MFIELIIIDWGIRIPRIYLIPYFSLGLKNVHVLSFLVVPV